MRRQCCIGVLLTQLAFGQAAITIKSQEVGHETRDDDLPSIAAAPDGSLWAAWLSYYGDRDEVAIRHYSGGKWRNLQWVPGTSGDSWSPQVAVDSRNRVWVVWSQQLNGNWDLYSRWFDPAAQSWGPLERLTSNPLPDINPRLVSDGKGKFAIVWQGFRDRNSNIYLREFAGDSWKPEIRITNRAANDWEPAIAMDSRGSYWVTYDTYKNGNYDVMLSEVASGAAPGPERIVIATAQHEVRPTVAVDKQDRVWVAWESGPAGWGKDNGYILRGKGFGAPPGGVRNVRLRCLQNGQWSEPTASLDDALTGARTFAPQVISDGRGSVYVAAVMRQTGPQRATFPNRPGYWEFWITHLEGSQWSKAVPLPNSKGRLATRMNSAPDRDGNLWLVWPGDNRAPSLYHRPRRHQSHVGVLTPGTAPAAALKPARDVEEAKSGGHRDEPADLRAIRDYTAVNAGRRYRILRGDLHRHTELSWDGGGMQDGSLQDFYRYMLDAASMDFGASTDHQGGAFPYWWWYTVKMADLHHVPPSYIPLFGYERSALYPDGHRNVFYAQRSSARVTPFFMRDHGWSEEMKKWTGPMAGADEYGLPRSDEGDEPGTGTGAIAENDTKLLYEVLRTGKGLTVSHTSGTIMGTDWRDNDPDLEPVVEIYQGARTSYEAEGAPHAADREKDAAHMKQAGYFPKGMVFNAWAKGYRLGVIASSDHGSTHLSYAMVYAEDASREGIMAAIRKRHTYGATDNIILDVRLGANMMGDEVKLTRALPIKVKARGTVPVIRVDVIKDGQVIYSASPKQRDVSFEYTDTGDIRSRHYYYVRLLQEDNMIAWSSPLFVNYR